MAVMRVPNQMGCCVQGQLRIASRSQLLKDNDEMI